MRMPFWAPRGICTSRLKEIQHNSERHIQDAIELHNLIPAQYQKRPCKVLDVGSGNGIPGIPMAILEPIWDVSMLDSDNKKVGFIDTFCKSVAINNWHVYVGRAESKAHGDMRESFEIVFARALGKLPTAIELASSFIKVGGLLIVPHGTNWEQELEKSQGAIKAMGVELKSNERYSVCGASFTAIIFQKTGSTASLYPRSVGIPAKRPL
jgi:16S rRNA (guanine527-N7)-methyltransferase